jgi:DNA-binding transcriptional regulator YdaS (Cro superfamily)
MQLSQWLRSERGRQARLARFLKVSDPVVAEWSTGGRPVPMRHGLGIERFTAGEVSRRDLFGDDCESIWPDLAAAPAANDANPAQAAQQGVANA